MNKKVKVSEVTYIENKRVKANFLNQLKQNMEVYSLPGQNSKTPMQLIKLMFHGSGRGGVHPQKIYSSQEGLDARYSNFGAAGQGVYFADNS